METLPPTIALTRNSAQNLLWAQKIKAIGADVFNCPLFEVRPLSLEAQQAVLAQLHSFLTRQSVVIFISPQAVEHAFLLEKNTRFWQKHFLLAAGQSTQKALQEKGLSALSSNLQSAEGLIDFFQQPHLPQQVAILRAQTGRDILVHALQKQNKEVAVFALYQRIMCDFSTATLLLNKALNQQIHGIVFTSSEVVRAWLGVLKLSKLPSALVKLPVFAIHPRIAQTLVHSGFQNVVQTQTVEDLIDFLTHDYQWNSHG